MICCRQEGRYWRTSDGKRTTPILVLREDEELYIQILNEQGLSVPDYIAACGRVTLREAKYVARVYNLLPTNKKGKVRYGKSIPALTATWK